MAEKENRCWPGYEPVPGKEPHSQGSCKPKAESKSSPSEKAVRANRRKELDAMESKRKATKKSTGSGQSKSSMTGRKTAPAKKTAAVRKSATTKRTASKRPAAKRSGREQAPAKRATTARSRG